jgi:hypothetical protein
MLSFGADAERVRERADSAEERKACDLVLIA